MRVAVLADIHGNLPTLEAVLRGIDAAGVDAIVLNGDLATGPMPAETVDRLAELGDRAIWVRGNADRELVAAYDGALNPDLPEAGRLSTEHGDLAVEKLREIEKLREMPLAEQAGRTGRQTQATRAAARKGAARATRAGKATVTEPKKTTRTS